MQLAVMGSTLMYHLSTPGTKMFNFRKIQQEVIEPSIWIEFENKISLTIPDEYKEVVNFFGPGEFDDFLMLFSPKNEDGSATAWIEEFHETHDFLKKMSNRNIENGKFPSPYNIGTNTGDLFFLTETSNGDYIFFQIGTNNVVLWDGELPDEGWQVIPEGILYFINLFLTDPDKIDFTPHGIGSNGHYFKPVHSDKVFQNS